MPLGLNKIIPMAAAVERRRSARLLSKGLSQANMNTILKQSKTSIIQKKRVQPKKAVSKGNKENPPLENAETITTTTDISISRELHIPAPFDYDTAMRTLTKADPLLAPLIQQYPCTPFLDEPLHPSQTFSTLIRSIIFQQLSGKVASTIMYRFVQLFHEEELPKDYDEKATIVKWFPSPESILEKSVGELRKVGLSERKASYIQDLAQKFKDKEIEGEKLFTMTDEEISKTLCAVKGIGQWTVDMFLMFHMKRTDVLPVLDLGVQKGVYHHFGLSKKERGGNGKTRPALPKPDEMRALTEKWRPFRSIGSWYMWKTMDTVLMEK
ncbi:uncharacterized protein VTP21DRAFT_10631 [Calcarisporiella thermophila]|uniref:uncharacterized protein n=1 Tax=Calcarisporiella thermophila TaxID=911321 RepID=UPI0037431E50